LVTKSIILHVNANQVVQPRCREAENPRDLFSMEKICRLVPVNPHSSEVVSEKVVNGIPREERQAVRNPVGFVWVVIEIGLGSLP
jgi:hypothetical protein